MKLPNDCFISASFRQFESSNSKVKSNKTIRTMNDLWLKQQIIIVLFWRRKRTSRAFSLACYLHTAQLCFFQIHDRDKCQIYISRTHVSVGNLFSSDSLLLEKTPQVVMALWRTTLGGTTYIFTFFFKAIIIQ